LVGAVSTEWRADLPAVAPNGWLALLSKRNVIFADGESLRVEKTVEGGAADTWLFITWNGFRRPDAPAEQPLTYAGDSSARGDSGAAAHPGADTSNVFATPADSSGATSAQAAAAPRPSATAAAPGDSAAGKPGVGLGGFTVQFAALRSHAVADSL